MAAASTMCAARAAKHVCDAVCYRDGHASRRVPDRGGCGGTGSPRGRVRILFAQGFAVAQGSRLKPHTRWPMIEVTWSFTAVE
jgi:hypothetical protein